VREKIDLTPYAGRPIVVRFEMVTDDAVNLPGLCIDDMRVPELGFSDDSNRYDGKTPYPHPHLICVRCREIMDPALESLAGLQEELVRDTGFRILSHRMDFFGICPRCQRKSRDRGRA